MKWIQEYKKYGIVLLIPIFFFFLFTRKDKVEVEETPIEGAVEIVEAKKIKVDIKGAIVNPGLYEMKEDSRVEDVISSAGGLLETADTSMINLSKVVTDEMVIIIYTKEEIKSMQEGNTAIKYIEKECICSSITNDACINNSTKETNAGTSSSKNTTNGKVSLNSASVEELMTLSGIGEKKALAIIEYRNTNGGFKSIEEITNVSGIGSSTFEKIKENLTL